MITPEQIEIEVNRMLAVRFSEVQTIYRNRYPQAFDRPSFLIETVKFDIDAANRKTVRCVDYLTITCFVEIDEHENAPDGALIAIQSDVMQLFRQGFVHVGDRALKVKASAGGADFDRSYVDLQLEFHDDRTDEQDTAPLMEEFDIETEVT